MTNAEQIATNGKGQMMETLSTSDIIQIENGEPAIQDIRLATILGYKAPRQIRELIHRNIEELRKWGAVISTSENDNLEYRRTARQNSGLRGRPAISYLLNEGQAVTITVLSKTERAATARYEIISTFLQYRRGQLPTPPVEDPFMPAPMDRQARDLALLEHVRLTQGNAAAARLYASLASMPKIPLELPPAYNESAIGCLRHMLRAEHQGVKLGQIIRSAFRGDRLSVNVLKELRIEIKDDGFVVPNIWPAFNALFDDTKWERPFEHLRKLPSAKPHLPWGGRNAKDYTFIPSTYLDEA
ncbi:hypothetical protein GOZ78_03460 [Agrobacterium vitis]|uniref:hypothetical protein n=1 Tax=Agrobacterium vitis TaxID=373 RepID=UPI0012E9214D|nr:hypothetical protein [Agrobacterium vitis]MVA09076.1 hypothetical protein [Agrobacterium vitis]